MCCAATHAGGTTRTCSHTQVTAIQKAYSHTQDMHNTYVACYRWIVMGPARSGSGLHVDPLATSAWNALISGHKRWALFPPGTQRHHVLPKLPGLEREAVSWFTHVYPLTQREDWPTTKPIDIIQVRLPVFVITSRLRGVFSCVVWEAELSAGLCILCNQPH